MVFSAFTYEGGTTPIVADVPVEAGQTIVVLLQSANAAEPSEDPTVTDISNSYSVAASRTVETIPGFFVTNWIYLATALNTETLPNIHTTADFGLDMSMTVLVVKDADPIGALGDTTGRAVPGTWPGPGNVDPVNNIPYTGTLTVSRPSMIVAVAGNEWNGPQPTPFGTPPMGLVIFIDGQFSAIFTGKVKVDTVFTVNAANTISPQNLLAVVIQAPPL